MKLLFVLVTTLISGHCMAYKITGQVKDENNQPLSFASLIIRGTSSGASANSMGYFSVDVQPGSYNLVAQHVGFKSVEKPVVVKNDDVIIDFVLPLQQYDLGNITVKSGEDQALSIIKKAIAKRQFYLDEQPRFQAEVYIKGRLQLRDYPKRFFGQKVDFEDGDTSKQKVIFLSETVARYSVNKPKAKVEVLSTKVSGQSNGFGFSNPIILSFYQNIVPITSLNPRGFVSPIADNALQFYRYVFMGTFFDNGKMVNRLQVMPRRNYEPLFNGFINIIEGEWRIHSVDLTLFKENQMQLADTLRIEQVFVPVNNTWIIKQQTLYPSVSFFGFKGYGSFVQVYDKVNLDPDFKKGFFDNTVLKILDSANKKSPMYWDSIRPVPLIALEIEDYKKKDSLEAVRNDPKYMDSLDRVRNKIGISAILFFGKTFVNTFKKTTLTTNAILDVVGFNSVEGLMLDWKPVYTKKWNDRSRNRLLIAPQLRYGFSNGHFNPNITVRYDYGKKYLSSVSGTFGKKVFQMDNREQIPTLNNSINTLYDENNFLKIYDAYTGRISWFKGLGEGITTNITFEYQDRRSLNNTTQYKWRDVKERTISPNITFAANKASLLTLDVRWQPGARYIELPERKILLGSKFPVVDASITTGLKNVLGSNAQFTKWRLGLNQSINLKLAGNLQYNVVAGGFLNAQSVSFPDFNHFFSNRLLALAPPLKSFQVMDYYRYSNTDRVFLQQHTEYHLNGLLTNKIPGFKKLNWFLLVGNNVLFQNNGTMYGEYFIGLENIFRIGRIDFVQSFTNKGRENWAIRTSFGGLLR